MPSPLNRRDVLKVAGGALLAGACGSDRSSESPPSPTATSEYGAMAGAGATTSVRVGMEVLASGGSAVDAAVTAALTAGVVELAACGPAGYGGHMVIAPAGQKVTAIDFNSTAPAAMREDTFAPDANGVAPEAHDHGWLSAGVPGTLAGMQLALERYGTRSFRDAVAPAIRFCRDGFQVSEDLAGKIRRNEAKLRKDPSSVALLFENGDPLPPGATFRNPDLADVLETLAEENSADSFYRGDIGRRIAAAFQKNGGMVTAEDLAAHAAREVEPVRFDWRGYSIYTGPLTAGGTTSIQALAILKALGWENYSDENEKNHARLEALRLAWKDRLSLFGDPDQVEVPLDHLLSEDYAEQAAAQVREAVQNREPIAVSTEVREQSGTVHLSAADRDGNMVALTLTHGADFGARVTVEGMGLILGHGMSRFDPRPGQANAPGPGKRPLHNMCPTVVLRDGLPIFALGGRGGRRIPNAVYDVLSRFVGEDRDLEAVDAPRMHTEGGMTVHLDTAWDQPAIDYIRQLGYNIEIAQSARISAVSVDPSRRNFSAAVP